MIQGRNNIITVASKLADKGQYDKAIREYEKIVAADSSDMRVWLKIADLHVRRADQKKAIEVFQKVADFYGAQERHQEAIAVYKQILRLDPRNASVYRKLGEVHAKRGLVKEALVQMEIAHRLLVEEDSKEQAMRVVERMVELDGESTHLRITLAEGHSHAGRVKEAVCHFNIAAENLWNAGRLDEYIKVAERLLRHDPDDAEQGKRLADIYLNRKEYRRALAALQSCFRSHASDEGVLERMVEIFMALGQRAKAVAVLKSLAKSHLSSNMKSLAAEEYRRVLELAPGDKEAEEALRLLLA